MTFSPSYTTPYSTAEEQAVEIGAFGVLVDGRGFITDTASNTPYNETWHRSSIDLLNSQQNPQVAQVAGVVASRLRAERCRP